jgi:hypothetical protein
MYLNTKTGLIVTLGILAVIAIILLIGQYYD